MRNMAELKQGGKEKDSKQPKPRLGDIFEYNEELTRQLRRQIKSVTGCPNIINWEEIKRLILLGADPNGLLGAYTPPLIHAIQEGNIGVCRFLVDNGADANFQMEHNGQTALMFAATKIHRNVGYSICELLILDGADILTRDKEGKNAIWYAADARNLIKGTVLAAVSYSEGGENDVLRYLIEAMLTKMLMERISTFMWNFRECVKG
jgi:ankyrin repeat protein